MEARGRTAAIVITAAVAVLAVLVAIRARADDARPTDVVTTRTEPTSPSLSSPAPAMRAEQAAERSATRAPASAPASPGPNAHRGARVREIEAGSNRPLPGAVLWVVPEISDEVIEEELRGEPSIDFERFARSRGRSFVADERGELQLDAAWQHPLVSARHGEHYGWCWPVPGDDREVLPLELHPDRELAIHVSDPTGERAGMVHLCFDHRRKVTRARIGCIRTDADGVLVLKHAFSRFGRTLVDGEVVVRLDPLLDSSEELAFPATDFPETPLRLTLPATGSLVVQDEDASGAVLSDEGRVQLELVDRTSDPQRRGHAPSAQFLSSEGGRVRFERVGLGLELRAKLSAREHADVVREGPGPARAGEEVVWTLRTEARRPILVGTALEIGGSPLGEVRLNAMEVGGVDASARRATARTDAHGRFRFALYGMTRDSGPRELVLEHWTRDGQVGGRSSVLSLPDILPEGELDLGEVVVAPLPILVAGVVLDDLEQPVASATVQGMVPDEKGTGWSRSGDYSARTDAAGRFELREGSDANTGAVCVTTDGDLVSAPVPFLPGQRELVVRMHRKASLVGSLSIDPAWIDSIRVFAQQGSRQIGARIEKPWGTFVIEPLEAGSHKVFVESDSGETLHAIPGFELQDGERLADPRLEDIDVRTGLHLLVVHVCGPGGRSIEQARIGTRPVSDGELRWSADNIFGGSFRRVSRAELFDVRAAAPGYRLEERSGVSGELQIVLTPALSVRLRAPFLPAVPEDVDLVVGLSHVVETEFEQLRSNDTPSLGTDRVNPLVVTRETGACFFVPRPGRWRLDLELLRQVGDAAVTRHVDAQAGFERVLVADVPDEQVFEILVDALSLEAELLSIQR